MKSPKTWAVAIAAVALGVSAWSLADDPAKPQLTSNQALMRDKLKHAQGLVEGLALERYDLLETNAKSLGMISRAAAWHVPDVPEYARLSRNFQEQTKDLEKHAQAKNLDACALDYVRISLSCVECHRHLREARAAK